MVLAMSVHSRKTRVASKEVENSTTKGWITYLIILIRIIKFCLENQYLATDSLSVSYRFNSGSCNWEQVLSNCAISCISQCNVAFHSMRTHV